MSDLSADLEKEVKKCLKTVRDCKGEDGRETEYKRALFSLGEALFLLAEEYEREGSAKDLKTYSGAVNAFEKYIDQDYNRAKAWLYIGKTRYKIAEKTYDSDDYDSDVLKEAVYSLKKAAKMYDEKYERLNAKGKAKVKPNHVGSLIFLGKAYYLDNEYRKSRNAFNTARKLSPKNQDAITGFKLAKEGPGGVKKETGVTIDDALIQNYAEALLRSTESAASRDYITRSLSKLKKEVSDSFLFDYWQYQFELFEYYLKEKLKLKVEKGIRKGNLELDADIIDSEKMRAELLEKSTSYGGKAISFEKLKEFVDETEALFVRIFRTFIDDFIDKEGQKRTCPQTAEMLKKFHIKMSGNDKEKIKKQTKDYHNEYVGNFLSSSLECNKEIRRNLNYELTEIPGIGGKYTGAIFNVINIQTYKVDKNKGNIELNMQSAVFLKHLVFEFYKIYDNREVKQFLTSLDGLK